jgi:hypothetical protein
MFSTAVNLLYLFANTTGCIQLGILMLLNCPFILSPISSCLSMYVKKAPIAIDYTQNTHKRYESSGQVISPSQRPLPDNSQHSQQKGIRASGVIRTRNPNKRAAADPRHKTARLPRSACFQPDKLQTRHHRPNTKCGCQFAPVSKHMP